MITQINNLSNPQLVTIAVALLNGDTIYVDREDIAIKVDEFAHGRFNWRKYSERIDMVAVVVALRDAKKPKNGALLAGDNTQGWMLSPKGIEFVKNLDLNLFQIGQANSPRRKSLAAVQNVECVRLRKTRAYKLFAENKDAEISIRDFYQFARVNEYFKDKARHKRYTIIENSVVGDKELSDLWSFLKDKFKEA